MKNLILQVCIAMDFLTILGLAAATITTISFLPQMFKTWQTKSAKDVSMVTLITFITGVFLWLIYGIYLQALPIILANSVTLLFNLIILWRELLRRKTDGASQFIGNSFQNSIVLVSLTFPPRAGVLVPKTQIFFLQHIPISLVFAYGIDGQYQIILSENSGDSSYI